MLTTATDALCHRVKNIPLRFFKHEVEREAFKEAYFQAMDAIKKARGESVPDKAA